MQEFPKYVEAINAAPRTLVGTQVPKIGGADGEMETLRDSADARDWQDAARTALTAEANERATRKSDDLRGVREVVTRSVELFQRNNDLVPRTKQFDKELADKVSAIIKPYELRVDGGLIGFNIDVQPIIESTRASLAAARAAAPAAPAAPSAQQQRAAAQPRTATQQFAPADAPQAGIPSKAGGAATDAESFDTLFGTLGLTPGTITI